MTTSKNFSARNLSTIAKDIYGRQDDAKITLLQGLRPYICPFDDVLMQVPAGSTVLDVGCGSGLFLLLATHLNVIRSGFGFDVCKRSVAAANAAATALSVTDRLQFGTRSIEDGIPKDHWDTVTVIDVLHHVPPEAQAAFVRNLCEAVPPGGRLIIKDMVARPRWRAFANQMHDLIMARQRVHHVDSETVENWARESRLTPVYRNRINLFWYGHWTLVLEKS